MNKIFPYVFPFLQIVLLVFLLWLTVLPVEVRWFESDTILAMGIPVAAIIGAGSFLFSKVRARVTVVDMLVTIWSVYYICRTWVGADYPCGVDGLKALEMMLLYYVIRIMLHDSRLSGWWVFFFVLLCGCYESILGIYQLFTGTGRHHLFSLTGTFQNPGPYSAYLMIVAVMGLYFISVYKMDIPYEVRSKTRMLCCILYRVVRLFKRTRYSEKANAFIHSITASRRLMHIVIETSLYITRFLVYVPLLVLPATWSRAAFVGFGLCALWIYRNKYWKYRYYLWGTLITVAVGFYFLKQGSANGRTLIWMASLTSWLHDAWVGVGIGGFRHACAEGIAEMWDANPKSGMFDSAGVTDYAYNSLLKILVEQGVVGALLCVATTVFALVRLRRQNRVLFLGMISLLIFSMFSYPFELLPYNIIAVVVIAWSESVGNDKPVLHVNKFFGVVIAVVFAAFGFFLRKEVDARYEADKDCILFSGMRNSAFLNDYYELLPYELDNPQYLFDFAKTLRECNRYMDCNDILRKGTVVSADPMFYIIMGNNYRDEQQYELAEQAYQKAYSIMPNRLYPLYQKMMMYADREDKQGAYDMAKKVRSASIKIESNATQQMRKKADSIYYRNDMIFHPEKYARNKIKR